MMSRHSIVVVVVIVMVVLLSIYPSIHPSIYLITLKVVNSTSQMLLFQRAQYCPAPPGDSVTRKSLFDSLVSGCVPVLFAKASLRQYLWFFTENEVAHEMNELMDGWMAR